MDYPYHQVPSVRYRQPVRARKKIRFTTIILLVAAAFALLIPLVLLFGAFLYLYVFGFIVPGVQVGGVALGGLNRQQAAEKLDQAWNHESHLVVGDGSRVWPASPLDFGLWIDPEATAEQAYQFGRGPDGMEEITNFVTGSGPAITPAVRFFPEVALKQLEYWAPMISTAPVDAELVYNAGQWSAVPGKNGSRVDVVATLKHIQDYQAQIVAGGFLPLQMAPVAPQIADLSAELERINSLLNRPVEMQAYDPITNETIRWTVPSEQLAGWLRAEKQDGRPVFSIDGDQLNQYLQSEGSRLGQDRSFEPVKNVPQLAADWENGRTLVVEVRHNPTAYTVQSGDTLVSIGMKVGMPYWKILEANPSLSPESTLNAGQTITIPSKNEMLPLPVVPGKRIVVSISQQRMWTYENGNLRTEEVISTGIDRSPTLPGIYQVQTHEEMAYASVWDLYMPNFLGIYEGWPGFMNGFHGLPTLSNGSRMWADSLGRKASYGCIILTLEAAQDLYNWAENGVVVEIQP